MKAMAKVMLALVGLSVGIGNLSAAPSRAQAPAAFTATVSGHGRPVLLIPGLGCSGAVWDATVEALAGRHELHVLTLAGFAGRPAIGAPFLPRVHDEIVRYVRDKHLDRPIVIGHSLGGFMAFWLSSTDPDLFGPVVAVDGVPFLPALMDPTATALSAQQPATQMREMLAHATAESFAAQTRASLQAMITDPAEVERVFKTSVLTDPAAEGLAMYELMTTDLRPQLDKITQPVLLIGAGGAIPAAARDAVVAAYSAQIAAIPQHEFVLADKARHFVMLDDPVFFQRTLDAFLARVAK